MEALALVVAFISGVLIDHFFFNKLAGYVTEAEAEAKAKIASVEAKFDALLGLHVKEININDAGPQKEKGA